MFEYLTTQLTLKIWQSLCFDEFFSSWKEWISCYAVKVNIIIFEIKKKDMINWVHEIMIKCFTSPIFLQWFLPRQFPWFQIFTKNSSWLRFSNVYLFEYVHFEMKKYNISPIIKRLEIGHMFRTSCDRCLTLGNPR